MCFSKRRMSTPTKDELSDILEDATHLSPLITPLHTPTGLDDNTDFLQDLPTSLRHEINLWKKKHEEEKKQKEEERRKFELKKRQILKREKAQTTTKKPKRKLTSDDPMENDPVLKKKEDKKRENTTSKIALNTQKKGILETLISGETNFINVMKENESLYELDSWSVATNNKGGKRKMTLEYELK